MWKCVECLNLLNNRSAILGGCGHFYCVGCFFNANIGKQFITPCPEPACRMPLGEFVTVVRMLLFSYPMFPGIVLDETRMVGSGGLNMAPATPLGTFGCSSCKKPLRDKGGLSTSLVCGHSLCSACVDLFGMRTGNNTCPIQECGRNFCPLLFASYVSEKDVPIRSSRISLNRLNPWVPAESTFGASANGSQKNETKVTATRTKIEPNVGEISSTPGPSGAVDSAIKIENRWVTKEEVDAYEEEKPDPVKCESEESVAREPSSNQIEVPEPPNSDTFKRKLRSGKMYESITKRTRRH